MQQTGQKRTGVEGWNKEGRSYLVWVTLTEHKWVTLGESPDFSN
jgi:hypothetical protein